MPMMDAYGRMMLMPQEVQAYQQQQAQQAALAGNINNLNTVVNGLSNALKTSGQNAVNTDRKLQMMMENMMKQQQMIDMFRASQIAQSDEPKRGGLSKIWGGIKNSYKSFLAAGALAFGGGIALVSNTGTSELAKNLSLQGLPSMKKAVYEAWSACQGPMKWAIGLALAAAAYFEFTAGLNFTQGYVNPNPK
ncbi:MAG: hypothetical protein K2X66_08905 [Cyanobacteria bacterium]|nr:hypothetical protein [Cyanobacteriota bacterium]